MRRGLVLVIGLPALGLACASSYGGDAIAPDDGGAGEEAPAAPAGACDPAGIWRPAQLLPDLYDPAGHRSPFLTDDELTIYFANTTPGDLLRATRAKGGLFGPPERLAASVAELLEADPVVSPDGGWLYFTSRASASSDNEIYRVPLGALDGPRERLSFNGPTSDQSPSFSRDGTLYFASDRSGIFRIYRAAAQGDGFAEPSEVAELSSPETNDRPIITADGLTIYWRSLRTDLSPSLGGEDIIVATRASTKDLFASFRRVTELSSAGRDVPGWVSPDGCRMYLGRSPTTDGSQPTQIYVASH